MKGIYLLKFLGKHTVAVIAGGHVFLFALLLLLLGWAGQGCRHSQEPVAADSMLSFSLNGVISTTVSIDQGQGIVHVTVPFGTIVNNLTAQIELAPGASVVPAGGIPQNYTKPIYYTVTTADGTKKVYVVKVVSQPQATPELLSISRASVRAGDTLLVRGSDFGNTGVGLQVVLTNEAGDETVTRSRIVDRQLIEVTVPVETEAANYLLKVIRSKVASTVSKKLSVRIAAPQISAIRKQNLLWGDSIVVAGRFIIPSLYSYKLLVESRDAVIWVSPILKENGRLTFPSKDLAPGVYRLSLSNVKEAVTGRQAPEELRIYDAKLPFIGGIINFKAGYTAGEVFELSTLNFEKLPVRFYQVQLIGEDAQYNQNGIYWVNQQLLSSLLPADISKGRYNVRVLLLSASGEPLYDIGLDQPITITQ